SCKVVCSFSAAMKLLTLDEIEQTRINCLEEKFVLLNMIRWRTMAMEGRYFVVKRKKFAVEKDTGHFGEEDEEEKFDVKRYKTFCFGRHPLIHWIKSSGSGLKMEREGDTWGWRESTSHRPFLFNRHKLSLIGSTIEVLRTLADTRQTTLFIKTTFAFLHCGNKH
ncbi:hypothetical protein L195_g032426, partial [Trifolium pratense]